MNKFLVEKPLDDYSPAWNAYWAERPLAPRGLGADVPAEAEEEEAEGEIEDAAAPQFRDGPADQLGHDGVGEEPEDEEEEEGAAPKAKAKAQAPGWYTKRLQQERMKRQAAERDKDKAINTVREVLLRQAEAEATPAADEENPAPKKPTVAKAPTGRVPTQAEFDAAVNARAATLASEQEFNAKANAVAAKGAEEFEDFSARIAELAETYDPLDGASSAKYNSMIDAIIDAGGADAHKIIYDLAKTPEKAMELMELSPVKLGVAIAKLVAPKSARAPSSAPAPIRPIKGGNALANIAPDDAARADQLPMGEWMRRRNEQIAKDWGR